jgi:hypothetical protein
MADTARKSLTTPPGILSFPAIFEARKPAPNAEPRFSIVLIFDEAAQKTPEFIALKNAAGAAAKAEWPGDKMPSNLRSPFRKGEEKTYAGYGPGKIFISAWSKSKPGIVDAGLNEILVPGDVWAGMLARATVTPFAYSNSGNVGVAFGLNNIQIIRKDMPRLDGRTQATKDFDAVDGGNGDSGGTADNPF